MKKKCVQEKFLGKIASISQVLALFDWLPDAHLYIKNSESIFMMVNKASALRNGFSEPNEIIGKSDFDIHPPLMAAAYTEEDKRVISKGEPIPEQIWLVYDYLGTQHWFLSTKIPLFDHKKNVIGLAGIMRPLKNAIHLKASYAGLTAAVEHVLNHYGDTILATDLSQQVGLSVSQFNRRFKKLFGISPLQFVLRTRINAARTALSHTDRALGEVALECGFYDQSQFAKLFKRETGMTPGDYRKRYQH